MQNKAKALVSGEFVVLAKLGQGGMGMVLKAERRRMKRVVALKVLSPNLTRTARCVVCRDRLPPFAVPLRRAMH